MDVAIIDYKMSNLFSVQSACEKVGLSSSITSDINEILDAKIAILPGVGAFSESINHIRKYKLDRAIYDFVESGKPFIGICLGLQLLFDKSEEFGKSTGLGLIKGEVKKFNNYSDKTTKYPVPQISWNNITYANVPWEDTILQNNQNNDFMYFVHSFYVIPEDESVILSKTNYGNIEYCSSIQKNNIFACQFHPEKSGKMGINIYKKIKEFYCK